MTSNDHTRSGDLTPFCRAAANIIEEDLDTCGAAPDLAAVVTRAHELAPRQVPREMVEEAAQLAPVMSLRTVRTLASTERDRAELSPMVGALRDRLAEDLGERRLAGIPRPPRRIGARRPALVAGLAVAAVVVLAVGLVEGLQAGRELLGAGRVEAMRVRSDEPWSGTARTAPARTRVDAATSRQQTHEISPRPPAEAVSGSGGDERDKSDADPDASGGEAESATGAGSTRVARRSSEREDRLLRLESEAQALWTSGDLAGAEAKLQEIVRLGGRGRHAELAYGDLFAIARQIHGPDVQTQLWRRYLARFPRGRFAEDARAGMCRATVPEQAKRCWRRYLELYPAGSHRDEATSRVSTSP